MNTDERRYVSRRTAGQVNELFGFAKDKQAPALQSGLPAAAWGGCIDIVGPLNKIRFNSNWRFRVSLQLLEEKTLNGGGIR